MEQIYVNYVINNMSTYFEFAIGNPNKEDYIKDLLANAGADINFVYDFNGSTLIIPAHLGNIEMIRWAWCHGASQQYCIVIHYPLRTMMH